MPRTYYNEIDPYAAAWLENLIAAGAIAPGDVDTRDIRDVRPADLDGYAQCHFFAGIGVWSGALRSAGWPDDRPVWTGSCPCQPLSSAGKRLGFQDERDLWPDWQWLIEQCRPETVFGEQVASSDGLVWADRLQADMEAADYALGFVDTCAAGFRSFHIRQRLYFVAHDLRLAAGWVGFSHGPRGEAWVSAPMGQREGFPKEHDHRGRGLSGSATWRSQPQGMEPGWLRTLPHRSIAEANAVGGVSDAPGRGCGERGDEAQPGQGRHADRGGDTSGELADSAPSGRDGGPGFHDRGLPAGPDGGDLPKPSGHGEALRADPADGFWRDADWLFCRDGKWRPVEPGTFPLAHAAPARLGRLRAYGNGLDLAQATGFVSAYLERDMGQDDAIAGDLFEWGV